MAHMWGQDGKKDGNRHHNLLAKGLGLQTDKII